MESSEPHKQQLPKHCRIVLQLLRYICVKLSKILKKISQSFKTHCCCCCCCFPNVSRFKFLWLHLSYPLVTHIFLCINQSVCVNHELMNRAVFVIDRFRVPCFLFQHIFLLVLSFSSEWISFYHWYNKTSSLKTLRSSLRCYVADISFYSVHQTMNRKYIFCWIVSKKQYNQ